MIIHDLLLDVAMTVIIHDLLTNLQQGICVIVVD